MHKPIKDITTEDFAYWRDQERLFDFKGDQISALFAKCKKANIPNITFHDTRHEAITRLAKKLSVLNLARMKGHRDLKKLMIY